MVVHMRGCGPTGSVTSRGNRGRQRFRRWVVVLLPALAVLLPAPAAGRPAASQLARSSSGGLHVIPFPGTPAAAASSDIIFSSLRPSDITSVVVTGSRSGGHSGHLAVLPDGAGTAFVPASTFTPGERVEVTASLSSGRAGTASGDPGSRRLSFWFGVGVTVGSAPASSSPAAGSRPGATTASASGPTMSFHSQANFHPPIVRVSADPDTASGDIFITARHNQGSHVRFQGGPMILDSQGRLVWFRYVNGQTTNLEMQGYHGQPVLTWWQGHGRGAGEDVILDSSYRRVAFVHAGHGYYADSHEFQITPQGTALLSAVVAERANLSSVGGPANGMVEDNVIQELDVETGKVLWEWHAYGHIPLSASYAQYRGGRYDFFHLNSIQQLPNHNLLISARHTWGVYEIDKQTGRVLWTLGGKHSNFRIGSGAGFEWQHDAHLLANNTLSVFDDASNGPQQQELQSSAKLLRLDFAAHTATLIRRFYHSPPVISSSQGSAQRLPNGNMFVGWGDQPDFSEYRSGGHQIFSGSLPAGAESYRAYRFQWNGQPTNSPSLALLPQPDGSVKVYASWNGATRVVSWRVLGGATPRSLQVLGGRKRTGFETEMEPHSDPPYLAVQALGPNGNVLGTSPPHPTPANVPIFAPNAFVRDSAGTGAIGVGCFIRQTCHVLLRISSGSTVLARAARPMARGTGGLMNFKLSAAGISKLSNSSSHRLPVQVTVHDSVSGASATRSMTLIPYSIAGSGPTRSVSQSATIQLVQTTGFVSSSTGEGQILAACYASAPCHIRATLSASGRTLARTAPEHLGVDELGVIYFKLSSAGRAMLQHAHGNQLPAQITLRSGSDRASGQIALVSYR